MLYPRRFCLFALAISFASLATGQNFFQKTYHLQQEENPSLAVLPNGHLITAGVTFSNANDATLLLQRLNEDGELLWAKTYPVAATSQASDILLMNDGNLLVCWNSNDRSGWMKVSPDGDLIWAKRLNTNFAYLFRLMALSDGNYLITGHRETMPTGGHLEALAIKIDTDGNRLWSNQFGTGDLDALGVCYEDDNGFLQCGGVTNTTNPFSSYGWLAKLGPNGALVGPLRRFDSNGQDGIFAVTNTTLDRLLLVGSSNGFGNGNTQLWLTEVDGAGAVRWSKTYDLNGVSLAPNDLLRLPGDQFMMTLNDLTPNLDNLAILFKIDLSGDIVSLANRYRTNGERDVLLRVRTTSDGFAMSGSARRNGNIDGLLIKTDVNGQVPGCCPAPVSFTIKNVTPQTGTFVAAEETALTVSNLSNIAPVDVTPTIFTPCFPISTDFTLSADTVCPGECVQITLPDPTPGATYSFSFSGGEPDPVQTGRICYPEAGSFSITRQGVVGLCSLSTTQLVQITSTGSQKIPTAFSPDNDGTNDQFRLLFDCPPDVSLAFVLRIYNRWGEIVYEGIDPDEGWDGTVNGIPAPVDVYIWQATVEGTTTHGELTLLR